jgi:hypothetical protein
MVSRDDVQEKLTDGIPALVGGTVGCTSSRRSVPGIVAASAPFHSSRCAFSLPSGILATLALIQSHQREGLYSQQQAERRGDLYARKMV